MQMAAGKVAPLSKLPVVIVGGGIGGISCALDLASSGVEVILIEKEDRLGGKIRQLNCSVCNSTNIVEGHHDDYTKPLEVRWLCKACHKEWHRHNKPIYE